MFRSRIVPLIIGYAGLLGCSESPMMPTQAVIPTAAIASAECDPGIDAVRNAVGSVTFLSRQAAKDETKLVEKLDAAQVKLDEGKLDDAIQKLTDFTNAVIALRDAAKPKISPEDAQTLLNAATAAIACIGGTGSRRWRAGLPLPGSNQDSHLSLSDIAAYFGHDYETGHGTAAARP